MIILNNIPLSLDTDFNNLAPIVADILKIKESDIKTVKLHRKSVDARRKNNVHFCCSFLLELFGNEQHIVKKFKNADFYTKKEYILPKAELGDKLRPIVVGFGPAGIFAALTLARAGLCPIVIERGADVDTRTKDINQFFSDGKLNPESNVQFGEGGAGTFSDGKLNTGIKSPLCSFVLEEFVSAGAPENILTDAKPHIGTDILKKVIKNLRYEIIRLGGEVRFNSRLEDLTFKNSSLLEITVNGQKISCNRLILATGHSARDIFELLKQKQVKMIRKPFSMGVRIEHKREDIDRALYGDFASHSALGAADYKLVTHLKNGRDVYTFCMCPGGEVINSSSQTDGIAINGMSENARNGDNSNSALLVGINPEDIEGDDILGGCALQREIEQKAFSTFGGAVPIETVGSFVFGDAFRLGDIAPTVKPTTAYFPFDKIFPDFVCESLKEGILEFDKKISGFANKSAILCAPETRSSSPVRILRNENGECEQFCGLFPCGEGAGYAGGIMSAAVDGIKTAEKVILCYK